MSEAATVMRAQCPYCLEEIIQGAQVCKHCGKKQPPSAEERKSRRSKWIMFGIIGALALFVLLSILAKNDYEAQHARMERAALCGGTTYDELESEAQKAAKATNTSITEAENSVMVFACPSMAH